MVESMQSLIDPLTLIKDVQSFHVGFEVKTLTSSRGVSRRQPDDQPDAGAAEVDELITAKVFHEIHLALDRSVIGVRWQ